MTAGGPSESVDVLVIGAGPSGLFAALELARHGVLARVVEREPEPHHEARATAVQPGTLEILADAGVIDDVLAGSVHLPYARVFDAELRMVSELAFAGAGCRWEFQCSLPQWRTERILGRRLEQLGVAVDRGAEVLSLEPDGDGIVASLRHADGSSATVQARYVVGAGGAHSITRGTLEEELLGETYPGTALVGDVRLQCSVPRDAASLVATPEGYVLLGPLPDERWITFIGDLEQDEVERLRNDRSREAVESALRRRITGEVHLEDVGWAAPFQMHRRLVARMAGPRRFLLGDAGHLSSPFGGEGLNSGLHDGHNLAWKLSLVLRGRGRPGLLESFASERLLADRHVLEVSDQLHALAHGAVESARTGDAPPPLSPDQVAAVVRSRSMLDVSYADSPLTGEYMWSRDQAARFIPGARYAGGSPGTGHQLLLLDSADRPSVSRLSKRWDGVLNVIEARDGPAPTRGAVLVRPDGYVGFCAGAADEAALAAVDEHLASYLIPA